MFPFARKRDKDKAAVVDAPLIVGKRAPEKPARGRTPPSISGPQEILSSTNGHNIPLSSVPSSLPPLSSSSSSTPKPPLPPRPSRLSPPLNSTRVSVGEDDYEPSRESGLPEVIFRPRATISSPPSGHRGSGSHAFGSLKDFDIAGLSLPALACVQIAERRLQLHRNVGGDFGFSIRRVQYPTPSGQLRSVVFAEPTEMRTGPPRPDDVTGLLPGDELIEVAGQRVSRLSRDELQELVRSSGDTINLVVRAVPELAEFCSKYAAGGRDAGDSLLLGPDVDTSAGAQESIPDDVRVWLLHKGGYTQARLLERLEDGRARIRVAGREMVVDATDVDKANTTTMDRVPDLATLKYLNETSAVHVLRHRFGSGLAYTNAGSSTLLYTSGGEGAPYNERMVTLFKGCRKAQMPPHVYATAQHVYRGVQQSSSSQSLLLAGVSGAGKTTQLRALCYYLSVAAGWTKALPFDRLSSALGVLQAMGNAATSLHADSSRFLLMLQLGFDKAAALKSARLVPSLLESERVLSRPEGESSFHVFYYLWEGATGELRRRLRLDEMESPSPMIKPLRTEEDREAAREAWSSLLSALSSLGASPQQIDGLCCLLAACLHLGRAEATAGAAVKAQFIRGAHATHAAALLGVTQEALAAACFRGRAPGAGVAAAAAPSLNRFSISNRGLDGPDALKTFVAALYQEAFYSVVEILNRGLGSAPGAPPAFTYINIVDPPGCTYSAAWKEDQEESSAPNKRGRRAAGLYDLVYNYVNDRIAEHFHDAHFAEMQELYAREQVDVKVEAAVGSPHPLNRLLDQKQQLLNSVDLDRRSEERRGLFAIVEEESVFPGASDECLLERIFVHLGEETKLIRRGSSTGRFVLSHGLDSHPTTYDVRGWVRMAYPSEIGGVVRPLMAVSKSAPVTALLNPPLTTSDGLPAPSESAMKLRRLTQTAHLEQGGRRTTGTGSFIAAIATHTDYVFSTVRRSARAHFIHCIQSSTGPRSTSSLSSSSSPSSPSSTDSLDVPYVRNQMRGLLLMDAVRASNRGYPERFSFRDFRRRFECLIVSSYPSIGGANQKAELSYSDEVDDRAAVQKILEAMDVHSNRFRLGISQVLLQTDVVSMLEERRELSLSGLIVSFQQQCRRHLAARWLQKRRALETAIRCVQKNGLAYMSVREWQWWKLYTRVLPLLSVSRADAETKEWEAKLRALERQIGELKSTKGRLEGRVAELEEEVTRSAAASHEMGVALEREGQARIVAERRLQDEEHRLSRVSSVSKMESTTTSSQVDESILTTLRAELEDARDSEEKMRVRTQRTVAQLHEAEGELAELRAQSATLEKKQARFDSEYRTLEQAVAEQKRLVEKAERERDEAVATGARRQAEAKEAREENGELRVQLARMRREVEESGAGGGAPTDMEALRKQKMDLEAKVRDQEDELDDLSGQRQMLQQQVTRLEMQCERLRGDVKREADARETECDEMRATYQRRLRAFEEQVADLMESNETLGKQNRLLETRCRQNDMAQHSLEYSGGQSRRELRKALALVVDTEMMLAHERENNQNSGALRQLREQLEDSEAAKVAALKSRHSLESELAELRSQLEGALTCRKLAEDKALAMLREKNGASALLEEKDEQMQALLKKYKASVQQNQIDGIAIADYIEQIADLMKAKQKVVDELNERTSQLEYLHQHTVEKHRMLLLEQKLKELQAKLDLEVAQRTRFESLVAKMTDEVEVLNDRLDEAVAAREREAEGARKTKREVGQLTEALEEAKKREVELSHRNKAAKSEVERLEEAMKKMSADLKLAEKRSEAMRAALAEGLDETIDEEEEEEEGEGDEGEERAELDDVKSQASTSASAAYKTRREEDVGHGMNIL